MQRPYQPARLTAMLCTPQIALLLIYVFMFSLHANASQLNNIDDAIAAAEDHNWHRIEQVDHTSSEQHTLSTRADTLTIDANDSPNRGNLTLGQTNLWKYSAGLLNGPNAATKSSILDDIGDDLPERSIRASHLELRKRESQADMVEEDLVKRQAINLRPMYISINVCSQPNWNGSTIQVNGPPQLTVYVGRNGNSNPGPNSSGPQTQRSLLDGFVAVEIEASSDTYIAVSAPSTAANFSGGWTYDLAVSIDAYYHQAFEEVPFLYLVDTDSTSALMVTDNLTEADADSAVFQKWMNISPPPFTIFGNPSTDLRRLGIGSSYCGLEQVAKISEPNKGSDNNPGFIPNMTTRGLGNKPKQQFFIGNMSAADTWNVTLAMAGNGTKSGRGVVGGGGTVWLATSYTNKQDGNCQLLFDLDFCDEVAYAVPSNSKNFNLDGLKQLYDQNASAYFQNFTYSLQQIACNTSNDQRYSLARDCNDCSAAYKNWLCAVTIPRCEDFSSTATYLQLRNVGQPFLNGSMLTDDLLGTPYTPMLGAPRLPGSPFNQTWITANATNSSRNPVIDSMIAPGPYKEVLPCEDLCYSLVQSCPAALQFVCPLPGLGLEAGYAPRPSSQSVVQCSYLGAVYYIDDAGHLGPSLMLMMTSFLLLALMLLT